VQRNETDKQSGGSGQYDEKNAEDVINKAIKG